MSVTAARGFRAAGVAAGIKASGRPDVALVVNDGPSRAAAGLVTRNRIKAAPVLWTEQVVKAGRVAAVLLNSGNANACTGPAGFADTHRSAELVGELLDVGAADVAVCSTGIIGVRLPAERLFAGIRAAHAALSPQGGPNAAEAIMTTDTVPKQAVRTTPARWCIGGMAKGAGMIAPELATMLVVLTTDADVEPTELRAALAGACAASFERIDTDGCMSTNDTVLLLASGASGVRPDPAEFTDVLTAVCTDLARQLVADAEGATKLITIEVVGAATEADAVQVARAVARSNLVKCAIGGGDPNWGRILAAIGTTTASFADDAIDVAINGVWVCRASAIGEDRAAVDLSGRDVTITIDLHAGTATTRLLTTDLTAAYVHENSAYST